MHFFYSSTIATAPETEPSSSANVPTETESTSSEASTDKPRECLAQKKSEEKIAEYNEQLVHLTSLLNSGMSMVTKAQVRAVKEKVEAEKQN